MGDIQLEPEQKRGLSTWGHSYSTTFSQNVLGLCGRVLVAGGYRRVCVSVGVCEMLPEASLCPTEPVPGGSKIDLLLAKAKPISNCW